MMRYRPLGTTGLAVSEIGFGCGAVGGLMVRGELDEQRDTIARAIEAGVTYFDTAQSYGDGKSEENLARTLGDLNAWDQVVVGTKIRLTLSDLASPMSAVRDKVKTSLKRLGRENIQLLQLHSRVRMSPSEEEGLPPRETSEAVAEAMKLMVQEGLVRHIGFTALGDTEAVLDVVRADCFDTAQIYVNALNPSAAFPGANGGSQDLDGMLGVAGSQSTGVIAVRALAAGAVSGTSGRAPLASPAGGGAMITGSEFETDVWRAQGLILLAKELDLENGIELSLRFVLALDQVSTVVVGFSDGRQLDDALRWRERGPLAEAAMQRIVELARSTAA